MSVRDQRMNNQSEFFFVITAKIVRVVNYSSRELRQEMLNRSFELN